MERIKICYFLELWESGGIESFLNGIIKSLNTDCYSVDIIAAKIGDSIFTEPLKARGVKFYELSGRLRSPKNYRLFKNILKNNQYDVIHFNIFQAFALSYASIAKKLNIPVRLVHAHGGGLRKSVTRPIKLIIHRFGRAMWLNCATHTLACSSVAARFFFGKDADEVIKNGIDTEKNAFSGEARIKMRKALGVENKVLIGCVGRLSSEKNHAFLLDAFAEVTRLRKNASLVLVGDGPEKSALTARAEALGISDRVIFYGASQDVPSLMSAMDVFVLPSLFEGLGIVALEAQASGLPVICSSSVPTDVCVTDLVKFVGLDLGAEHWANVIIKTMDKLPERISRADEVRSAGFDTADSPKEVFKYYALAHSGKESK